MMFTDIADAVMPADETVISVHEAMHRQNDVGQSSAESKKNRNRNQLKGKGPKRIPCRCSRDLQLSTTQTLTALIQLGQTWLQLLTPRRFQHSANSFVHSKEPLGSCSLNRISSCHYLELMILTMLMAPQPWWNLMIPPLQQTPTTPMSCHAADHETLAAAAASGASSDHQTWSEVLRNITVSIESTHLSSLLSRHYRPTSTSRQSEVLCIYKYCVVCITESWLSPHTTNNVTLSGCSY